MNIIHSVDNQDKLLKDKNRLKSMFKMIELLKNFNTAFSHICALGT